MGTVCKIGDDYYVEFVARGLTYQRNGGKDKAAALALLRDIEAKIEKGELGIVAHDEPIGRFVENFLAVKAESEDARTMKRYRAALAHFKKFLDEALTPNAKMSQITPSVLEEYRLQLSKSKDRQNRALKAGVKNFTLILLKDILDKAINFGHINDNPILHVKMFEVGHVYSPELLSPERIKGLSQQFPKEAVILLLRTGLLVDELIRLKWTSVDLAKNCIKIESAHEGPRRPRAIPIDSEALIAFKSLKSKGAGGVFDCKATDQISQIDLKTRFLLRNTFAKMILDKGVSLTGLHRILGFKDIARVMHYTNFLKQEDVING